MAGIASPTPPIKEIEAVEIYYVPATQSLYDARITAIKRARIKALADKFGTLVTSGSEIEINSKGANVTARGLSEVKGEWLGDVTEAQQKVWYDNSLGSIVIETRVRGKAREYASPAGDIQCRLLHTESVDAPGESCEFYSGDNMFLHFRCGRSGFLAAFLIDDAGGVHTLLPYTRDTWSGTVAVDRKKDYLFFSQANAPEQMADLTDRYRLRTSTAREHNRICVVYSPHNFTRSSTEEFLTSQRPQFQRFEKFDNWLFKTRSKDPDMVVIYKDIFINRAEK